jgi:sugar phosphate isomerase/epimerase
MAAADLDNIIDDATDAEAPDDIAASGSADELLSQMAEEEIDKLLVEDSNGGVAPVPAQPLPEITTPQPDTVHQPDTVQSTLQTVDTAQSLLDEVKQQVAEPSAASEVAKELEMDDADAAFEDATSVVDPVDQEISDAQIADAAKTIADLNRPVESTNEEAAGDAEVSPPAPGIVSRSVLAVLNVLAFPVHGGCCAADARQRRRDFCLRAGVQAQVNPILTGASTIDGQPNCVAVVANIDLRTEFTFSINTMQLSIASFAFHGQIEAGTFDIFTYLEACRYRYQLDTADIWNGLLGKDVSAQLDVPRLRKVRQAMDERGLTCVNYHADGCHPWEATPEQRQKHAELATRHLQAAEILGARTVRIDTGGADRNWTGEQFDFIVTAFKGFAQHAHDAGFKVGPETHWGATNYPDNMLKLHAAVDHPAYGILLHLGKDTWTSPDDYDKALAPIAIHTHVDQKTCYSRVDSALKILIDAGYQGALGVEHHSGKNELVEVEAQIALVRRSLTLLGQTPSIYRGNPLLDPKNERAHN